MNAVYANGTEQKERRLDREGKSKRSGRLWGYPSNLGITAEILGLDLGFYSVGKLGVGDWLAGGDGTCCYLGIFVRNLHCPFSFLQPNSHEGSHSCHGVRVEYAL